MPTGPQKIILIGSGCYEYAEVQLDGAIQIVGPNNTGKTTLINTLQFLYLDDRRHMDFGSYSADQTRDFYFPNQYSYLLFECLGAGGACVIGWRGQSRTSGHEPERFCYEGPFQESDFLDDRGQVREPRDVNGRLALKQFRVLKSAQEHREALLAASGEQSKGLGIVVLRDPDKYHQFRESLKCLLTLSAITQEQMRDRLLMMAEIPPDRTAINERALFGDDYDRIRARREGLVRFKRHQPLIEQLVEKYAARESLQGDLIFRWSDLRARRQQFTTTHEKRLETYRDEIDSQRENLEALGVELKDRQADQLEFSRQEGGWRTQLEALRQQDREFAGFIAELEKPALARLQDEILALKSRLGSAEGETREKARQRVDGAALLVKQAEQTIARFDTLAITALRKHFDDQELTLIFRLLSRDLLEIPVGPGGMQIKREQELVAALQELLNRVSEGVYDDVNLTFQLPQNGSPLAGLENVEKAREQLSEHQETLKRWEGILHAIEERQKLEEQLRERQSAWEQGQRRLMLYEQYQTLKLEEPRWLSELKQLGNALSALGEKIVHLQDQIKDSEVRLRKAEVAIQEETSQFATVVAQFEQCLFPEFDVKASPFTDVPSDFPAAIAAYLRQQALEQKVSGETRQLLGDVERYFGEEFRGADDAETLRLLREELEALEDKEEALERDWNAHIHGLKATFDRVLKELGEIHSANDQVNRQFAKVPVSNLTSVRMEVVEQSDLVGWIRRLANFEPGGLFDNDPDRESALVNFRTKLQDNPLIRFADLFTLGVTVVGPDGRKHTYHDFRQIESHGTTVAIKVLFNLLLLKSQLKRDDCRVPFFLDEIQMLDPSNRHEILTTARKLGFLPITAAPEAVSEVDTLYFLQPRKGRIMLRNRHRVGVKLNPAPQPAETTA
jgi:hypothetical protein